MWLGINDEAQEGRWVTPDNIPVSFTDWASGEPNSFGDKREEDCVEMQAQEKWNDEGCCKAFNFICEKGTNNH